jgi:predicted nuclease with TOPRIM domain
MAELKAYKIIYLQVDGDSFGEWEGQTWCQDRINDTDVEYILKSEYDALQSELDRLRPLVTWNDKERVKLEIENTRLTGELSTLKQSAKEMTDEVTLQTVKHMNSESRLAVLRKDLKDAVGEMQALIDVDSRVRLQTAMKILRSHGLIGKE